VHGRADQGSNIFKGGGDQMSAAMGPLPKPVPAQGQPQPPLAPEYNDRRRYEAIG
jgi:hypothetical protein